MLFLSSWSGVKGVCAVRIEFYPSLLSIRPWMVAKKGSLCLHRHRMHLAVHHKCILYCLCENFWQQRTLQWSSNHLICHVSACATFFTHKSLDLRRYFDTIGMFDNIQKAVTDQLTSLTDRALLPRVEGMSSEWVCCFRVNILTPRL